MNPSLFYQLVLSRVSSILFAALAAGVAYLITQVAKLDPAIASSINEPAVVGTLWGVLMAGINFLTSHSANKYIQAAHKFMTDNGLVLPTTPPPAAPSASSSSPGVPLSVIALLLIPALFLQGCASLTGSTNILASLDTPASLANISAGTQTAVQLALVAQPQYQVYAPEVYKMAVVLRSYTGGDTPAPADLQSALAAVHASAKDQAFISAVATDLSNDYSALYQQIGANASGKAVDDILEALAEGIEDATAIYIAAPEATAAKLWRQSFNVVLWLRR